MFILYIVNIGVAFEKLLPINDMSEIQKKNTKGTRVLGISKFDTFLGAVKELLPESGDWNSWVVACTDEDLLFMLNAKLAPEHRISEQTWRRYKRGEAGASKVDVECLDVFVSAYKRAVIGMKRVCMQNLQDDVPGGWQRYAWILERKFDEWNLRTKTVDETPDVRRLVLRVADKG
jgi:hypothetical protein